MQQKMTGINNLVTAQKVRLRSMTQRVGQEYLDMYLYEKRQERHDRERENLDIRQGFFDWEKKRMLREMRKVQQKLSKALGTALPEEAGKPVAGKAENKAKKLPRSMKKMDLSY